MLDAKFLEDFPLYRKYQTQLPDDRQKISLPGIQISCPVCGIERTFIGSIAAVSSRHKNQLPAPVNPALIAGKTALVEYTCASCKDYHQFYLLYFDMNLSYVMKVGQYAPWSISVEKDLAKILGEHQEIYRKGKTCESQGYGIGAYAYYRRIVENVIDTLLDAINDLLEGEDKKRYEPVLAETKKSIVAKEKIALVKDLLPASLRPDNMNPLGILHDRLSSGIHDKTDEECLELAGDIREILIRTIEQVQLTAETKDSKRLFTDSMRRLLEKKA